MKRTAFDASRDQRIANESMADQHLMCSAHGCPLRWSVNFGETLCSVHNRYERHDWPRVTEWLVGREEEEAFRRGNASASAPASRMTVEQKREVGQRLRRALRASGGRQWAERLREREESGERLTDAQRSMWREAIGVRSAFGVGEQQP